MPAVQSSVFTAALVSPEHATPEYATSDYTLPKKSPSLAKAPERPRILSVSADLDDHSVLQRILHGQGLAVIAAASCGEALDYLSRDQVCVVFCDSSMPEGSWKDLLYPMSSVAEAPPLVVTSRLADDYLWSEVLNLGGWDVLAKPFREQEVLYVVDSAWTYKASAAGRTQVAGAA
jgi:DNA-binding NtrC family response regulator